MCSSRGSSASSRVSKKHYNRETTKYLMLPEIEKKTWASSDVFGAAWSRWVAAHGWVRIRQRAVWSHGVGLGGIQGVAPLFERSRSKSL
jgi:hypothetical protein